MVEVQCWKSSDLLLDECSVFSLMSLLGVNQPLYILQLTLVSTIIAVILKSFNCSDLPEDFADLPVLGSISDP